MSRRNQRRDRSRRARLVFRRMRRGYHMHVVWRRRENDARSFLLKPYGRAEAPLCWRGSCALRALWQGHELYCRSEYWRNQFNERGLLGQPGSPQPYP
ncbi:MAG TPA: hypothetical protein VMY40_14900 [Anaerolineae bacterium]|nr:hypothetical protein [Anaerolineae bacterium]